MPKYRHRKEILLYAVTLIAIFLGLVGLEAFEAFYEFSRVHEEWELDEIALIIPAVTACLALFSFNRVRDVRRKSRELKESKEALARANTKLVEMARTRDEFLTIASHELRSPLVGIVNSLNLMKMAADKDEREESLKYAISSAKGMSVLIDDVLSFARLSRGEVGEASTFAPSDLLDSVRKLCQLPADANGLELQTILDESVPQVLTGNATGLRLAVLNLAGNGIKFTKSGGVTVHMACNRGSACTELVVRVTDTGIGISDEDQAVIFEPYRMAANGSDTSNGIGLGLSLVKRVVEKMDGSISVSSTLGQGSEFTVRIPVDAA